MDEGGFGRMKMGTTYSETISHTRHCSNRLFIRWIFLICILSANIVLSVLAFYEQSSSSSGIPGLNLSGVVRLETQTGTGTGFLVSQKYVLTAAHVVKDVNSLVTAIFPDDNKRVNGQVIASGYSDFMNAQNSRNMSEITVSDWALIELDSEQNFDLTMELGDDLPLEVGEDVWLIGYPGGDAQNVSKGILSGKDARELRTDTDADPGYSGGPMVSDSQKLVIGIVVSAPSIDGSAARSVTNAVPIDIVIERCESAGYSLF